MKTFRVAGYTKLKNGIAKYFRLRNHNQGVQPLRQHCRSGNSFAVKFLHLLCRRKSDGKFIYRSCKHNHHFRLTVFHNGNAFLQLFRPHLTEYYPRQQCNTAPFGGCVSVGAAEGIAEYLLPPVKAS
jgi:hypothetical protein